MTLEHKRLLYESILTKSEDESEAQNQLIVVSDLLNFILVRQPQQRPDLKAIHDKLSNYELQLADKSIPLTPALTPIDIMCNQVRILDMHRPERWDKIKLFHRIYLGCKAEWDGESVLYLTCCTNTATIRPTSCLAVPQPHSTSSSAQEIHFAEHFLKQVQLLCKLLWDLYLTNKTVLSRHKKCCVA
ncbi:hypothetical protein Ae201684P_002385 [Aphanomyces euteiches]|nr:hypothetical protein Ae201684P_002385 [Aphanomyces euteiches]